MSTKLELDGGRLSIRVIIGIPKGDVELQSRKVAGEVGHGHLSQRRYYCVCLIDDQAEFWKVELSMCGPLT